MLPRRADILGAAKERRTEAERFLERLVNQPSGSHNPAGVARALGLLGDELAALGFAVEAIRDGGSDRHLVARRAGAGKPILLIGHADTVFPETDDRRFAIDENDLVHGPGCADMKGGLVVALEAIRLAGKASGALEVIINGDEELGSPTSRDLIRERARSARAALVYENCEDEDGLIIGRKGLGRATLRIRGRGAHAGVAPEKGASAVVEMARKVLDIAALDDPKRGVGVVVGIARGGISRNTVPPEAEIEVDIRYREKPPAEQVLEAMRAIAGRITVPGTATAFEGELHRPPMAPETAPGDLFARANAAALLLGMRPLRAVTSGGGSDANLTADLGIPTLDGLGVVGGDIHTKREWCLRRSLPERAALSAAILLDLMEAKG